MDTPTCTTLTTRTPADVTLAGILARFHRLTPVHLARSPVEIPRATRNDLPKLFRDLGFTVGAEIGVWSGKFSIRLCGTIPALHLYAVDPYLNYPDYRDNDQRHLVASREKVAHETLAPYHVTWLRKFAHDAAEDVPLESLDFVYIDGNHAYEYVVDDLAQWTKRVRPGGIISGHDYHTFERMDFCHITEAVDGWTHAYGIHPWFLLGLESEAKQVGGPHRYRSFMWVKS